MTDSTRPLLGGGGGNDGGQGRDGNASMDDVARRLEEGLSAGDVIDFDDLLKSKPDFVLSYLAEKGARKLGSFIIEDTEVLPLMQDGNIWVFGDDRLDIDWEAAWRRRLAEDNYRAKGFPTKVEVEAWGVAIRNAALPDDRGLLNPLLEKWQDGAMSTKVFGLPAVHGVIQFKWDNWARRVLIYEFLCYLVWLVSFQVWIVAFQDEDLSLSFSELWYTARGKVTITSSITALVGMAPFLWIEACTVVQYGPSRWLSAQNAIDVSTYILQILLSIAYFGRFHLRSDALSILAALQVLLLWWRIQYFARAFQQMRNTFLNTIVAVVRDVRWFLALLIVTLWGFAGANYILFRDEQSTEKFDNPWHAMVSMFTLMLGDVDVDLFYNSKKPVIGVILLVVFLFVMTMVLLNLLIAIMSDAAARAADDDGTKYLCSKAELIDELETSLPAWARGQDWYPAHIHILKVNPKTRDTLAATKLWAKGGTGTDEDDDSDDSKHLGEMVKDMRGEVGELKALLQQALGQNNGGGRGFIGNTLSSVGGMLPFTGSPQGGHK